MKLPFVIYGDLECILKKYIHFKMILKNLIQGKIINIHPLVFHCLHNVHLMQQKISLIVIEVKIV